MALPCHYDKVSKHFCKIVTVNKWICFMKIVSESRIGMEPVSFWLQVRHSSHWGAETQTENEGYIDAMVWFICALPMRQSL